MWAAFSDVFSTFFCSCSDPTTTRPGCSQLYPILNLSADFILQLDVAVGVLAIQVVHDTPTKLTKSILFSSMNVSSN